ncbi:MarR family transcriptional regulator [Roseibium salinum]|nr:MarR family transcriptional regulator [Roseibium salinum]
MVEDVVRSLGYATLGSRLKRIGERLQAETQELAGELAGTDLPTPHNPVLAALDLHGPLSIGDLAKALGHSQPGVTRMINKMKADGLVVGQPDDRDRRVSTIALTEKGAVLVATLRATLWPAVTLAVEKRLRAAQRTVSGAARTARRRAGRGPDHATRSIAAIARLGQPRPTPGGRLMIKRIWHGWTTLENAATYLEVLTTQVIPGIEAKNIPGFLGIEVLRRELADEVEFLTIMSFSLAQRRWRLSRRGLRALLCARCGEVRAETLGRGFAALRAQRCTQL